jgi:hypothetical protein
MCRLYYVQYVYDNDVCIKWSDMCDPNVLVCATLCTLSQWFPVPLKG